MLDMKGKRYSMNSLMSRHRWWHSTTCWPCWREDRTFRGPAAAPLIFTLLLLIGAAAAEEGSTTEVEHWALAPFLGTGAYRFDEEEMVFIFEYTPRWLLREGSKAGDLLRRAEIELRAPAALGLSSFELKNLPASLDPGNVASLSVVPGLKATVEMNERWMLRARANLGFGARLDGEESAWIYRAGVRSLYALGEPEQRWNLIAALDYIGYDSNSGRHAHLLPLTLAVELELAVDAWASENGPTHLVTHLAASHYLDELSVNAIEQVSSEIKNDLEIGFAIRPATPFRLWKLSWERIGIAYRRGDGDAAGDDGANFRFEGLRLFFGSVFDQ